MRFFFMEYRVGRITSECALKVKLFTLVLRTLGIDYVL